MRIAAITMVILSGCYMIPDYAMVPITKTTQEQPVWCWASASQMAIETLKNTRVSQCEVATERFSWEGYDCCGEDLDKCIDGIDPLQLTILLERDYELDVETYVGAIDKKSLKWFLSDGRVIIIGIHRMVEGKSYGHVAVVFGYNSSEKFMLADPDEQDIRLLNYDDLISNGGWNWYFTLVIGK